MTTLAHHNRLIEPTTGGTQLGVSSALQRLLSTWQQWRSDAASRRRAATADQQLWNAALADPRIMADIARAQASHPGEVRKRRMMRMF